LLRLPAGSGDITTEAFSPDGKLLAAGAIGGSAVYLWDLPTGKPHRPLLGHVTGIVEMAFSPDGMNLATGGYDTVRLWNVATEREILSLPRRGTFRGLAFSPDGQTLAAAYLTYPGHRVHLYRAPPLSPKSLQLRKHARNAAQIPARGGGVSGI
jgi:WD40 repeat protein